MRLWIGLGNPEAGMARNRHNIGFMALDRIAARHGFSPWREKFKGLVAEGVLGGGKVLLLKPLTYMNLSGEAAQAACSFYRVAPPDLTAWHDELDIPAGELRMKQGGGAAGHNGLRSIDRCLGRQDYWRVRLGIGHPGSKDRVTGHVLSDFTAEERAWLEPMLDRLADAAAMLVEGKVTDFIYRAGRA